MDGINKFKKITLIGLSVMVLFLFGYIVLLYKGVVSFSSVAASVGGEFKSVKTDKYSIETPGINLRGYMFSLKKDGQKYNCITVVRDEQTSSPSTQCFEVR